MNIPVEVDVQIVNYKTKDYLERCVASVTEDAKSSGVFISIHVVDNASGDDLDYLEEQFSDVHVHYLDKNYGFGAGNNVLARKGNAPYILILNPDTQFIEPHTISRLLRWLKEENGSVVGPRLVTDENITQVWDHGDIAGWFGCLWWFFVKSSWHEHKSPTRVAWVSGACLLIKRSAFQEVGGFDEGFFLYHEELDMEFRLGNLGHAVWYDPTITVFHKGSVVASKEKHMEASDRYLAQKYYSWPLNKFIPWVLSLFR